MLRTSLLRHRLYVSIDLLVQVVSALCVTIAQIDMPLHLVNVLPSVELRNFIFVFETHLLKTLFKLL